MHNLTEFRRMFKDPPRDFSPCPIWWWSGDRLDEERLLWQLGRFADGGVYNIVVLNLAPSGVLFGADADHPRFFSQSWWSILQSVCEEAKKLGVNLWFYDQIGFSGANFQARLVEQDPDFSGLHLGRVITESGGPARLMPPAGATALAAFAVPVDPKGNPTGNATSLDLRDGGLDWDPDSQATTRAMLIYAQQRGFDYLNPSASATLLDTIHGEYERRLGGHFGQAVAGTFQDELAIMPRWRNDFPDVFRKNTGYDIIPRLVELFEDVPGSAQVRTDYHRVVTDLAEEAFFKPLHQWHERHGLLNSFDQAGPGRMGDPIGAQHRYLDYMRTHRWYTAPGSDHHGDANIHSSLAHLYNRPRVWIEAFHSSGWGGTLEETFDWLLPWLRAGATLYNPHAVYYSTRSSWFEWASPSTCWRQPYWQHYKIFADAISRLCYSLSRGAHVCDVALMYPATTIHAENPLDGPEMGLDIYEGYLGSSSSPLEQRFERAQQSNDIYYNLTGLMVWHMPRKGVLERGGWDFDVIDEDSLNKAKAALGELTVAQERYRALVLPAITTMRAETADQLVRFAEDGGLLIFVGCAPERVLGDTGDLLERIQEAGLLVKDVEDVASLLATQLDPRLDTGGLPYLRRRLEAKEGDLLFLVAPQATKFIESESNTESGRSGPNFGHPRYIFDPAEGRSHSTVRVQGVWHPELLDFVTGKAKPLPYTVETVEGAEKEWTQIEISFEDPAALIHLKPGTESRPSVSTEPVDSSAHSIILADEWKSKLVPTTENRWGDFAHPAHDGPLPIELRETRFRMENTGEDGLKLDWESTEYDDTAWDRSLATFGPYWEGVGPIQSSNNPPEAKWRPLNFSRSLGIEKDPIHEGYLGPSGHVPSEYLDLGYAVPGQVGWFRTWVSLDEEIKSSACIGGPGIKKMWVNGTICIDQQDGTKGYFAESDVEWRKGSNEVLIRMETVQNGRLRAWLAIPYDSSLVRPPTWIWHPGTIETGQRIRLRGNFHLDMEPESMIFIGGTSVPAQFYLNDKLVGRQGEFDPYKHSVRCETYDVSGAVKPGLNTVIVEAEVIDARNMEGTAGVVVDIETRDTRSGINPGQGIWRWSSGIDWQSQLVNQSGESGEWVQAFPQYSAPFYAAGRAENPTQYAWRRAHPLAEAEWLEHEPYKKAVRSPIFDIHPQLEKRVGWYRFRLPPGAHTMRVRAAGTLRTWVEGREVDCGNTDSIRLPEPKSLYRTAAIRIELPPGRYGGAGLDEPIRFKIGEGRIRSGDWTEQGLPHYSGGMEYSQQIQIPPELAANSIELDLGRVRGTAEVIINGTSTGIRLWRPYKFDVTGSLKPGSNSISVRIFNTLGPHYATGMPTRFINEEQVESGLFGPTVLCFKNTGSN